MLVIKDLLVYYQDQVIVKKISLRLRPGETVLLMGPNGSGKSTLVSSLMGHPNYEFRSGYIKLDGEIINKLKPEEKVAKGLFLAWQNPIGIPGVSLTKLLRELGLFSGQNRIDLQLLRNYAQTFAFSESLLLRGLNDGFSGGERKKIEMLQAILLAKKYVLFDEIDTGLDLDALRQIAAAINKLKQQSVGCLVVTHYPGLFSLLDFDRVLVMKQGKLVKEGKSQLATQIAKNGYAKL